MSATRCSPSARRSCAIWPSSNAGPGGGASPKPTRPRRWKRSIESGQTATQRHVALFNQALAAAHLGLVEAARSWATEGVQLALSNDDSFNANWNRAVLGFLSLSLGEHEQAYQHLEPVVLYMDRMGAVEPGIIPCIPDAIEALISLGRLDEAASLLDRLTQQGKTMGRPWALAASARCRGLLLAARGDLDGARVELEAALGHHGDAQQPFELGRTLMAKGQVERRAKQKRAARSSLDQALRTFESLGAPLWAERARSELSRVGGPAAPGELTPDRATGRGARGARAHESRGRGRPVREREDGRGEPLARVPQDGGQDSTRAAACHASRRRGSGIRREPTAASSIGFIPDSPRLRAAYRRRTGRGRGPRG